MPVNPIIISNSNSNKDKSFSTTDGIIVGSSLGGVLGLVLLIWFLYVLYKKYIKHIENKQNNEQNNNHTILQNNERIQLDTVPIGVSKSTINFALINKETAL